jgi:predicted ThiF/HesA family dinucleotide-utilizing enzyme
MNVQTVFIIGAGALGSHVALFGRNWKQRIILVDGDRAETKNTQAQFHPKQSIRKNKAMGLKQTMQGFWGRDIKPVPNMLTEDNIDTLFRGISSLIIDCTDNAAARKLIQDYCKDANLPCLHGAMSADGTFACAMWTEDFVLDHEGTEGEATCEDGENLPLHGMYGALIANVAQRFLTDGVKESFQFTGSSIVRLT